jgi:hypothetical protein
MVRYESLGVGLAIVVLGIYLVASHGSLAGVNIPSLLGLPCSGGSGNSSTPCLGFGGYSIGTVVVLFGFGLVANGLRAPSAPKGTMTPGAVYPPGLAAMMSGAYRGSDGMMPQGAGPQAGIQYCPKCGRGQSSRAQFCQQCGQALPPPTPVAPGPASSPPRSP